AGGGPGGARPAAASLADQRTQDRDAERRERPQALGDRLRLAPLLGADAGIRALRVDEGEDRAAEALGEREESHRLPVAFRARHPEVARDLLRRRPPPLLADDDDRAAAEARDPPHDGGVVAEATVAMQLDEIAAEDADVVEHRRPVRVPRELDPLPWRQTAE